MRAHGIFVGAALVATALIASLGTAEAQTPTLTTLYNFTGDPDGDQPSSALLIQQCFGSLGRPVSCLYGTTISGGAYGGGTVFKLTPNRSGVYGENVLHSFNYGDGDYPYAGLIADNSGVLYGTTVYGGAYGDGAVFKLTPNGSGGYGESVLYSFAGGSDGDNPWVGLIADGSGALYGTAGAAGGHGHGTVFKLTPNGSGGYSQSTLYSFAGGSDGAFPQAGLFADATGVLHGTTYQGGGSLNCSSGCGTVFKLERGYLESVQHSFSKSDGAGPSAGLIADASGALYGTTQNGGASGNGTVFKLTPNGSGGYNESVLHSFTAGSDGATPTAGLLADASGAFYGTTIYGGGSANCAYSVGGCGTVFKLTPNGLGGYSESVLHSFNLIDGASPVGGLIADGSGVLYGTTAQGGLGGDYFHGTVFKLTGSGFTP